MKRPTCRLCQSQDDLIEGDGPPICRNCIDLYTKAAASEVEHERWEAAERRVFTDAAYDPAYRYYSSDRGG